MSGQEFYIFLLLPTSAAIWAQPLKEDTFSFLINSPSFKGKLLWARSIIFHTEVRTGAYLGRNVLLHITLILTFANWIVIYGSARHCEPRCIGVKQSWSGLNSHQDCFGSYGPSQWRKESFTLSFHKLNYYVLCLKWYSLYIFWYTLACRL